MQGPQGHEEVRFGGAVRLGAVAPAKAITLARCDLRRQLGKKHQLFLSKTLSKAMDGYGMSGVLLEALQNWSTSREGGFSLSQKKGASLIQSTMEVLLISYSRPALPGTMMASPFRGNPATRRL